MRKKPFRERIGYLFDCMMSKGPFAMSILLLVVTGTIVGTIGFLAYFVSDDGGILYQLWSSLMYTLDAGNLAGVSTDNVFYLILMFLATLCGLFLTSILIGIITTGVEGKLNDLRRGLSVIQEENHTVIIGFNKNIYDILRELIEANSNKKKSCIVILGEESKEEMEEMIFSHISHMGKTRVICRSGNLHEYYALERCSIESCKSVIINVFDDAETIKILLALSSYLKDKKVCHPELRFIASLHDSQYVEAANLASEGRAEIINAKDAIARIIANTCREHGLSQVLTELFNFSGNELYFENVPEMEGRTFKEAMLSFANAIVVGVCSDDYIKLNPPMNTVIQKNNQLILLEADDGAYNFGEGNMIDETKIFKGENIFTKDSNHLVILGSNNKLPIILSEYDKYVEPETQVVLVDDDLEEEEVGIYDNLKITICAEQVTRQLLYELLDKDVNNILLLNDDSMAPEDSDSQTLLHLILLRDIADKTKRDFLITTEMQSVDNQRLASQARVDDFVIGSNFSSLLMAQLSENPRLTPLITDILDESGSEFYMKPIINYVAIGEDVDSYVLTESAARKGEIYVGYKRNDGEKTGVVINPDKREMVTFGAHDQIVVISEK